MTERDSKDIQNVEKEDLQESKYLTFNLGDEEYGIEISNVTEIIGIQKITDLPETPQYVKGVINLRGKVIPLVDVRLRFQLEEKEYNDRTCIVVVNIQDMAVGLIVDTVCEVLDIQKSRIDSTPTVNNKPGNRYIHGLGMVGDDVKILLDTEKLLFDDELDQIAETMKS